MPNTSSKPGETWAAGDLYEGYVGRWSRQVAKAFLPWLDVSEGWRWLDVGCGTGALTEAILAHAHPAAVVGVDLSPGFIAHACAHVASPLATFEVGDAQVLALEAAQELMRYFWDAAIALDPAAGALDEGWRFTLCKPGPLCELFVDAGLTGVDVQALDVPTVFRDFDDYWKPFLAGNFPAPAYAMSLDEQARSALRERLRSALPTAADGSIALIARAWAVRGTVPEQ